ncbi:MAG: type II toxin-antitoxin system HigB family toxin [Flavobacteriales bacterium]|nr:type II toxin-antitoxin system HigB family toxin [Flavobacteriales bacterium]
MRVHLIKKQSIEDYAVANVQSRQPFMIWLSVIRRADWNEPNDIKSTFGSADILGGGSERVVFDIGGNKYRMICKYHFGKTRVHLFVKWIGTHAAYTKLCDKGNQYTVGEY